MNNLIKEPNWNLGIVGGMAIGNDFYGDGSSYDFDYVEKEVFNNIASGSTVIIISSATSDGIKRNLQNEYSKVLLTKLRQHGYNSLLLKSIEFKNKKKVQNLLKNAALIIELGGNTLAMVGYWKATGFSDILKKSIKLGVKYIGISAGAIALFSKGLSDSFITEGLTSDYYFVDGINYFQDVLLVPHYSSKKDKIIVNCLNEETVTPVICIPNGITLLIDEVHKVYKFIEQPNREKIYGKDMPCVFINSNKIIFNTNQIGLLNELLKRDC